MGAVVKSFGWVLFLGFVFVEVFAIRPRLVDEKLWFINQTVLNIEYEAAVVQMEFDQELYLRGESFICGLSEKDCPETNCVPCDWSSQQPTDCEDVRCCGPAQKGDHDSWDQVNEWCEPDSIPPYHTLNLNERSKVFTLEPDETVYFRFFVSEEYTCKPFKLSLRPLYGVPLVYLSNLYAVPTAEKTQWREGDIPPGLGWALNNLLVVCPNAHIDYQLGTYSLAVYSFFSSSFDVKIEVSPQEYPLIPPPGRILCKDVPESEIIGAQAGTDQPTFCLQDTETLTVDFGRSFSSVAGFVLPIPPGCHQVSFSGTLEEKGPFVDVHCMPKDTNQKTFLSNSLISRYSRGENRVSFSMCSDVVSYVRCGITFWIPGRTHVIFSTVSIPLLIPLAPPSANTPSASFSYQEALSAMSPALFGIPGMNCGDFFPAFCQAWMVPSTSDPLIFWPPSPQLPKFDTEGINVYEQYYNVIGAQPLKNTLTAVILLAIDSSVVFPRNQLEQVSLALLSITNELGEVPELPNNAFDLNEKTPASPSQYLATIPLSSFTQINLSELCDQTSYERLQIIVNDELSEVLESDSLETIEFHKYVVDILGAGIASSSCKEAAIEAMNTQVENVTLVDQSFCQYELGTEEYEKSPCCAVTAEAIDCCIPFTIVQNQEQFTTADSSTCGVSECANTYFEDLAHSLNHVKDLVQGCSSGIKNFRNELGYVLDKELNRVVRGCLNQAGLRDDFKGIDCVADFQCEQWSGKCNHQTKKCVLGTTSEVEDGFLRCYISKMSPSLEDYLRLNILPKEASFASRDSEIFFLGLKSAALVDDCIATNEPLDIFLRSRYVWTALESLTCKAEVLGLPVDDIESVNEICPPGYCLGTSCKQSGAQCYTRCLPLYVFHASSEAECSSSSIVCPVTGLPESDGGGGSDDADDDKCKEGNYCVYCPGGEDEECIYVPGDQDFCENTVACELGDGDIIFGLSAENCYAQTGHCSTDCPGESCRSLDGLRGVCLVAVDSESLCEGFNKISNVEAVWYEDSICVVNANTLESCIELSLLIDASTNWETCESVETTSCNGKTTFQRYLKCFVDLWHQCESQEECENSGYCTDRPSTTIIRSDADHQIDVQFGACFTSGIYVSTLRYTFCPDVTDRLVSGCREAYVQSPESCISDPVTGTARTWLTPAMSETECRNKNHGRYGCQLPLIQHQLLWLDDEDCDCRGGINEYPWEWFQGVWSHGVSRTLHWREIQPVVKYQWTPSLSFELLQKWLEATEEQRFSFAVKSEVICENNYVSSSLNLLVCDCFSNSNETVVEGDDGDNNNPPQCYNQKVGNQEVEELVGVKRVCVGETSFVKGPSSRVSFALDSISEGCTLLNLSIVSEAWFVVPPPRPSISFEFEKKLQLGIVLNQKSATVGVLRGDGSVISFRNLVNVKSFLVCLLVSDKKHLTTEILKYPVPDIGYSKKAVGTIYPLGISDLNTSFVFGSRFWCGTIVVEDVPEVIENTIRLYPISRFEDYEEREEGYTSRETRALMYTLGVCYCICFALLLIYFVYFLQHRNSSQMLGIISFLLIILCVFRVVFMFGYPNEVFDGNELAEFIVFEIPTFLLFSVVITSIFFWQKVASQKTFMRDSDKLEGVVIWGLIFVWSLWVIVTIVYSEVILKEEGGESPCPGRVAPSYDKQEESTRTLSIIYQSLIISVTFVLGAIFCFYSYTLIKLSKRVSRPKRFVMVIGGVIVLSFFIRCLLFILILAIEFVSSVYMFITLMITEVFLLFFLQLQFNYSAFFQSELGETSSSTRQSNTPVHSTQNEGENEDLWGSQRGVRQLKIIRKWETEDQGKKEWNPSDKFTKKVED